MEMTVKEVLIAARAKIADPANWTQGVAARDKNGVPFDARSGGAVCWCSVGAVVSVANPDQNLYWQSIDALDDVLPRVSISRFNDTHTHAEVLAKFDEAIAAQGGE